MAYPTKTLDSLANRAQNLPVRFFHDPTEADPFVKIIDAKGLVLAIGINTAALIGPTGLLASEFEPGEVSTLEIADGALSADADGRAKIATDYFDVATVLDLFEAGALNEANLDVLIADNQFTFALMNSLMVAGAIADDRLVSSLVKEPGHISVGRVDFGATGDCTSVDVGPTAVYTRHDTAQDSPNGVWEDGATAGDSATNLALAINGDTRNSSGPYYAALASGGTCFIFALAIGTTGNVSIVRTGGAQPDALENLIGGTARAVKQVVQVMHVVTTEEADAVEVVIPLPFDADFFEFHVYDTDGGILATEVTDRGTVIATAGTVPAYFRLATNGGTHVSSGDIIRLTAQE